MAHGLVTYKSGKLNISLSTAKVKPKFKTFGEKEPVLLITLGDGNLFVAISLVGKDIKRLHRFIKSDLNEILL